MSDDLVRFDFRFQKSMMSYKMTVPNNMLEFYDNLKLHSEDFMYDPCDELIVLYPTLEGKMVEIKSDEDIEFLMKTKLCFDFGTKEVHCSTELLIIVEKIIEDDSYNQIKILNQKFKQLSSQIVDLEASLNKKVDEYAINIQKTIWLVLPMCVSQNDGPHEDTQKTLNSVKRRKKSKKQKPNNLLTQEPKLNVSEPNFDQQQENTCEKLSTIVDSISVVNDSKKEVNDNSLESEHTTVIENQPKTSGNKTYSKKDKDHLIDMLKEQGYTSDLRNLIILARFNYDYEKALNYLKESPPLKF